MTCSSVNDGLKHPNSKRVLLAEDVHGKYVYACCEKNIKQLLRLVKNENLLFKTPPFHGIMFLVFL